MNSIRTGICFYLGASLLAPFFLRAQNLEPAPGIAPPAPSIHPTNIDRPDVPGLPRVLLLGDSISSGYFLQVRDKLTGLANVHRPPENCGPTERGVARLDLWLGTKPWDVIHFNFGLHDIKYLDAKGNYVTPNKGRQVASTETYRRQLSDITARLVQTGAKVIFATTTPVPPGAQGRVSGDEIRYNAVATEVMRQHQATLDDLWGYVAASQLTFPPHPLSELLPPKHHLEARPGEIQKPFDVHYTAEGYEQLANLVVASIRRDLPPPAGTAVGPRSPR